MVQRLKTAREGWFCIFKTLYMTIAFPCAVVVTIPSLFMAPSLVEEHAFSTLFFFIVIWLGVFIPLGALIHRFSSSRRLLRQVSSAIKNLQFFWPDAANEMCFEGQGKYLGIDIKNGTVLYVHRIRGGQVDVVALAMEDWIRREVEGNVFRLYTKFPQLPKIEVSTPWAQRWYDTLGAMEHQKSSTGQGFVRYVRDQIDNLERDNNIHIPRLA